MFLTVRFYNHHFTTALQKSSKVGVIISIL